MEGVGAGKFRKKKEFTTELAEEPQRTQRKERAKKRLA